MWLWGGRDIGVEYILGVLFRVVFLFFYFLGGCVIFLLEFVY